MSDINENEQNLASFNNKEEAKFWLKLTERAFQKIWNNPQDDVYAELLEECTRVSDSG